MNNLKNIPIFPLKSIILPGGQFPLRIFERRYLDMIKNSLKNDSGFVIALTKKDADYISSVHDYACYVEIVDWSQLDGGLLGITVEGKKLNVDTGFIVFNKETYPLFTNLLDNLNVKYEKSNMSFSVYSKENDFEYNGTSLNSLFSQRKNICNYRFLRMIYEITRFNKISINLLKTNEHISLGNFLKKNKFSNFFCERYILPMGSAIWSTDINKILEFPAIFFIKFFKNHGMLNINDRPQWLTIKGGSKEYVERLTAPFKKNIKLNCEVELIERNPFLSNIIASSAPLSSAS